MKENIKQWPDDYHQWVGTFDELVQEAGRVLNQIGSPGDTPTASLVRYYQQHGAVGRGRREGRSSVFGFEDLAKVVAVKQMVKQQVPLSIAREMMANTPADSIARNTGVSMTSTYASSPAAATSMALTSTHLQPKNAAEQMVAKLLSSQACPEVDLRSASAFGLQGATQTRSAPFKPAAISSPSPMPALNYASFPPGGVLRYALENGLTVEIAASDANRHAQAQALRAFADQIDPLPPTTWSIK